MEKSVTSMARVEGSSGRLARDQRRYAVHQELGAREEDDKGQEGRGDRLGP
jgi:hypothetical protein